MIKRQLTLDEYKTAEDGLWTLTRCKINKAQQVQNFMDVPGRYAPLDLSTVLTDGLPYYGSAALDVGLESSEGTRAERQKRIDYLVNRFDGMQTRIVHPDHPDQYLVGRVQVVPDYNDLAHCSVSLTAVLEPWFYNADETVAEAVLPSETVGKNILPYPYATTTITKTGISWVDNGDGSITAKGTPTAPNAAGFQLCADASILRDGVTYTLSCGDHPYGASGVSIFCYYIDENGKHQYKRTFTWSDKYTFKTINIQLNLVTEHYDFTFYPQMEISPEPTAYEPYYPLGDQLLTLSNDGKLAVLPTVRVTGAVTLSYNQTTRSLNAGTYQFPDLYLTPGKHFVVCSGEGSVKVTYREAVLAA